MRRTLFLFTILIIMSLAVSLNAQTGEFKRLHPSISAGVGLPKIPFSQFRAPISVTGSLALNVRMNRRFVFQLNGGGLYSFSLGSFDNRNRVLRFNLLWSSVQVLYQIRGVFRNFSFASFGIGEYFLDQRFDQDSDRLTTPGIHLSIANWTFGRRAGGVLELKWHLLFNPDNYPQVATITYGWLF